MQSLSAKNFGAAKVDLGLVSLCIVWANQTQVNILPQKNFVGLACIKQIVCITLSNLFLGGEGFQKPLSRKFPSNFTLFHYKLSHITLSVTTHCLILHNITPHTVPSCIVSYFMLYLTTNCPIPHCMILYTNF